MTREHDIGETVNNGPTKHGEGAPHGAPKPSIPAGEPEAPVTPATSVPSGSVAPQPGGPGAAAADGAGSEDHERQLENDIEQLTAKAEKAQEYLELAQRTRADFENYRKRAARDAATAQERGVAKLAKELLPAVDNLDRALQAAESTRVAGGPLGPAGPAHDNGTTTLVDGIKLVHDEVVNALARAGIERFSPEGERFDPQEHEAIAQLPVEGKEPGTVVEVYQRGYRLGDVVIRPARVVVAA
jgi:molecular chaperone GrpE